MRLTPTRGFGFFAPVAACALVPLLVLSSGCSSSEETYESWETPSTAPPSARGDYRIDSLIIENRRLKQQLEAMAIENRKITAHNAELEMKLNEGMTAAAAPTEPTPAPTSPAPEVSTPPATTERPAPVVRTPAVPRKPTSSADLFSRYSDAMQVYRNHDFSGAITQFEQLLKDGIGRDLADNCHYWIGQSYYDMKQYSSAIPHFENILSMRVSDKKPDAQLMIANCYLEMGDRPAAKVAYQKVITDYPTSPYRRKAEDRLSRLR
jgi:tol-pal system protein YbgF